MPAQEGLASLKIDRARRRGGRRSIFKWVFLAALVAAGAFAFATAPVWLKNFQSVDVTLAPVAYLDSGGGELSAAGYVVADRMSVLAFKGTGRLQNLNVVEAQEVRRGEIIGEIDHHELDAVIDQAKAELAESQSEVKRLQAMANYAQAEASASTAPLATIDAELREIGVRIADAKRRYDRDKKLADKGAMGFSEADDRLTEIKMAEAQSETARKKRLEAEQKITVAESQVAAAKSATVVAEHHALSMAGRIKVLEAQLADAQIFSPFDGVVIEKAAEIGEIVAPISIGGSMARGSIATIAERKSLQAEVDVAEAYISKVKVGQRASVVVDAFSSNALAGKVLRILPRANRSKATVQVRVEIDNIVNHKEILPDMGLRVKFLPDDAPPGAETANQKKLAVPKAALQGPENARFVWVFNDSKAVKSAVTIGETKNELVEIKAGVKEGQKIVVKGAESIKEDGQKVKETE